MNPDKAEDQEGEKVMEAEEAIEGGIADGEAASDSVCNRLPNLGDSGYKAGDNGRPSEAHLPSRKDVSDKGGRHH